MIDLTNLVPEWHCQDLLHIDLPLQHLRHQAFIWSLFHLFSPNQVNRLGGQDQIPLDALKKKEVVLSALPVVFWGVDCALADWHRPWSVGHTWWLCQRSQSSLSCPGTAATPVGRPCPGSRPQSSCWDCAVASPFGSAADRKLGDRCGRRHRAWEAGRESQAGGTVETHRTLLLSPSSLIWTYFLRATYFLQAFWMVLA